MPRTLIPLLAVLLSTPASATPPNIIYILADDLGYQELGCYGQEKIRTPNIDRLATEGMRFREHYSGSPVCASSRCALLTGKHLGHAVVRGNREVGGWGPEEPEGQMPLPAPEVTIGELLQGLGYTTGIFGKWGLGGPGSEGHPNEQGFDHFYGYLCQRVAHNYYPTHLWRNHDVDVLHGNRHFRAHQRLATPPSDPAAFAAYRGDDYAPRAIADETLAFIRANHEEPFFVLYSSVIPHLALQVPDEELDAYPRDWDPEPYLGQRGYLPHPRPRAAYAAMISHLDANVGRLLTLLEELEIADDTIVLFSSDNGTTYVGGCDRAFFDSLGPLRGHKGTLWEGGIRVPMIARWPGRIAAGVVTDHISAFPDVLPTLMELCGGPTPIGIDGLSFAPTLLGDGEQREHAYLYWEHPEGGQEQAIRVGRHKAIRRGLKKNPDAPFQLFDLETDIGESTDLAETHPDIVRELRSLARQARVPSPVFEIPALDGTR
ncbi:MAG: arylsulfatase [Phycisphaerae bacterium]|nr:arylsulfatase [Phycisphaerae bacterium]